MKKSLIATSAALALATIPVFGAYAIDSQSHDVTVGKVDETIYSVDINWSENMVYDWKYNEETKDFNFRARIKCHGWRAGGSLTEYLTAVRDAGRLYSDENCSTEYTSNLVDDTVYYVNDEIGGKITVQDFSENGKVSASATFATTDSYNWAVGKFANFGNVTAAGDIVYYDMPEELSGLNLDSPIGPSLNGALCIGVCGPITRLEKYFYLEKSANANVDSQSINTSDKIGTITINITPDYN